MVYSTKGECGACGHDFILLVPESNTCKIFRCDTCGEEHEIYSDKIMQFIDGSAECSCGGFLRKDAPPRCPTCYSTQVNEAEEMVVHG